MSKNPPTNSELTTRRTDALQKLEAARSKTSDAGGAENTEVSTSEGAGSPEQQ